MPVKAMQSKTYSERCNQRKGTETIAEMPDNRRHENVIVFHLLEVIYGESA